MTHTMKVWEKVIEKMFREKTTMKKKQMKREQSVKQE